MSSNLPVPVHSGAVIVAGEGGVEFNLDGFPAASYNRLIPTQTLRLPSDLMVPVVQVVALDPADSTGKSPDHYSSADVPAGRRALTARGLNKVALAAGVSFFDERRTDDGTNPDVLGVSVMASIVLPTGQRVTAPGSQMIDIRSWFGPTSKPAEIAKFRKQFYAQVSTRARNRAIRGLLTMQASYPDREIARPFACVTFVPNMNHPEVRSRLLDAMAGITPALYGQAQAPQLSSPAAAPQLAAGDLVMPEAPEQDAATDATFTEAPGDEPDWMRDGAPRGNSLADKLRQNATASGLAGGATAPQLVSLRGILSPLGGRATVAGLRAAFGDQVDVNAISAAQAQAIIACSGAFEDFAAQWAEMASGQAAA